MAAMSRAIEDAFSSGWSSGVNKLRASRRAACSPVDRRPSPAGGAAHRWPLASCGTKPRLTRPCRRRPARRRHDPVARAAERPVRIAEAGEDERLACRAGYSPVSRIGPVLVRPRRRSVATMRRRPAAEVERPALRPLGRRARSGPPSRRGGGPASCRARPAPPARRAPAAPAGSARASERGATVSRRRWMRPSSAWW